MHQKSSCISIINSEEYVKPNDCCVTVNSTQLLSFIEPKFVDNTLVSIVWKNKKHSDKSKHSDVYRGAVREAIPPHVAYSFLRLRSGKLQKSTRGKKSFHNLVLWHEMRCTADNENGTLGKCNSEFVVGIDAETCRAMYTHPSENTVMKICFKSGCIHDAGYFNGQLRGTPRKDFGRKALESKNSSGATYGEHISALSPDQFESQNSSFIFNRRVGYGAVKDAKRHKKSEEGFTDCKLRNLFEVINKAKDEDEVWCNNNGITNENLFGIVRDTFLGGFDCRGAPTLNIYLYPRSSLDIMKGICSENNELCILHCDATKGKCFPIWNKLDTIIICCIPFFLLN